MKTWTVAAALLFVGTYGIAQSAQTTARRPCEDLKAEIAKKLDDKGVVGYSLDVVDKGKEGDGKVVGGCDGGTKSILYSRGGSAQASPSANTTQSADAKKPQ
jgi:hypothetical protein